MERAPLTRQRSAWAFNHREHILGVPTDWYWRRVNDGTLNAAVAEEPAGWHMSISLDTHGRAKRYPRWDEIAHARDELLPADVDFVMWLPRSGEYVALHDTTFHLHEHPPRGEQ